MTGFDVRPTFDSTSAAGAMLKRHMREPILVGCILAGIGTSAAQATPQDLAGHRCPEQTIAGNVVPPAQPSGAAIGELRRLSGLTWDQLANIFSVSRRSLHFWASGKPMAPRNEEHLQRVLRLVRQIDRGAAAANRTALLGASEDGTIPFELLVAGNYERVMSLLGSGSAPRVLPPKLAAEARVARAPRPPEELVGALQERVHSDSGALRAAKSVRVRSAS